jgi:hypothetical protein
MRALGRGLPAERFAWAAAEFGSDGGQVLTGADGQAGDRGSGSG